METSVVIAVIGVLRKGGRKVRMDAFAFTHVQPPMTRTRPYHFLGLRFRRLEACKYMCGRAAV